CCKAEQHVILPCAPTGDTRRPKPARIEGENHTRRRDFVHASQMLIEKEKHLWPGYVVDLDPQLLNSVPASSAYPMSPIGETCRRPEHSCRGLLLEATRGVTIAIVSLLERKRRQPGLAADGPAFIGWHQ